MTDAQPDAGPHEANAADASSRASGSDAEARADDGTDRRVPNAPDEHCLNCGAPLHGRYCSECGQKNEKRIGPLGHLLAEVLDELSLDARFFRTIKRLLRPGFLTRAYLDGRRADFVPPLRLFVIVSFGFIILLGLDNRVEFWQTGSTSQVVVDTDSVAQDEITARLDSLRQEGSWRSTLEAEFLSGALQARDNPEQISQVYVGRLSVLVFALLPVFAALLKLLYRREYYAAHLIFSLHVHTVALLLGTPLVVGGTVLRLLAGTSTLGGVGPWLGLSGFTVISVAVLIYTFFALRRAYGGGWLRTAAKFSALVLIYSIVVGVGFVIYSLGVMLLV